MGKTGFGWLDLSLDREKIRIINLRKPYIITLTITLLKMGITGVFVVYFVL